MHVCFVENLNYIRVTLNLNQLYELWTISDFHTNYNDNDIIYGDNN